MVCAPVVDPFAREVALLWSQRLDGEYLTESLPEPSRQILVVRLAELEAAFVAWEDTDLFECVAEMLRPYRLQRPPEPPAYLHVLKLHLMAPVWAALHAIDRVRRGLLPKAEFFPLPGHLRAIAWRVASPFQAERIAIGKVLRARPPRREATSAERALAAQRILGELRGRTGWKVGLSTSVGPLFDTNAAPLLDSNAAPLGLRACPERYKRLLSDLPEF